MCSPSLETHILSNMCVLVLGKHISHISCVICISTLKTHTPSGMSSPTREQMSHSDLCFSSREHIIFKCYVFPYTGTDISSDVFFFYPRSIYPKQNGFPVSGNTLVLKQGHQLQTAKNSQCLLSVTSNWELELKQGWQLEHCRFRLAKQQCHTCVTLFLHICQQLLDDDNVKTTNFTFVEDGNTRQQLSL